MEEYLYVCNTSSDNLSVVDLKSFREECKIPLEVSAMNRAGPHGICKYKDKLLVANNYSNSISIVDRYKKQEVENYFIGMHCNDAVVYGDRAYVICGETNYSVEFNLLTNKVEEEIPCENLPHSIEINKQKKLMVISNFESDSLTLIDLDDKKNITHVKVGSYPTKAVFSVDGNYILVCESNLGSDVRGNISIISLKGFKLIDKLMVGKYPVDMCLNASYAFVSNFGDGTVSMVDINCFREVKKINIGGMPRGIMKIGDYIYVGDNYNNLLLRADIKNENKKVISIGGEPTGMTYI